MHGDKKVGACTYVHASACNVLYACAYVPQLMRSCMALWCVCGLETRQGLPAWTGAGSLCGSTWVWIESECDGGFEKKKRIDLFRWPRDMYVCVHVVEDCMHWVLDYCFISSRFLSLHCVRVTHWRRRSSREREGFAELERDDWLTDARFPGQLARACVCVTARGWH